MLNKKSFEEIRSIEGRTCVSIYIPTVVAGDYEKNRIRWKNAVSEAENKLAEIEGTDISILADAKKLIDNPVFWAHQSAGLVGFYADNFSKHFHLSSVDLSQVLIDENFYTSPLLQEVSNNDRVFILALSKNETRFFEAVNDGIYPVNIHDVVVKDMDDAMNFDENGASLQHHGTGGGEAQFHGNNAEADISNIRTKQYLRRVDDGLCQIIHDERVPLVLAAVEEYHPIYKEVTSYKFFSDHMIPGNPESLDPVALRNSIDPFFTELKNERVASFHREFEMKTGAKLVSRGLDQIEKDAEFKNVDQLMVYWDYMKLLSDEERRRLDNVIMQVFDAGGNIHYVEEAGELETGIKAINRFAMENVA